MVPIDQERNHRVSTVLPSNQQTGSIDFHIVSCSGNPVSKSKPGVFFDIISTDSFERKSDGTSAAAVKMKCVSFHVDIN